MKSPEAKRKSREEDVQINVDTRFQTLGLQHGGYYYATAAAAGAAAATAASTAAPGSAVAPAAAPAFVHPNFFIYDPRFHQ